MRACVRAVLAMGQFGANMNTGVMYVRSLGFVRSVLDTRDASRTTAPLVRPPENATRATPPPSPAPWSDESPRWEQPVANEAVLAGQWHHIMADRNVISSRCWFSSADLWAGLVKHSFLRPVAPRTRTPVAPAAPAAPASQPKSSLPPAATADGAEQLPELSSLEPDKRARLCAPLCRLSTFHANCAVTRASDARVKTYRKRVPIKSEHMLAVWRLTRWCQPWCLESGVQLPLFDPPEAFYKGPIDAFA